MTLNGVMAVALRYFTEFDKPVTACVQWPLPREGRQPYLLLNMSLSFRILILGGVN